MTTNAAVIDRYSMEAYVGMAYAEGMLFSSKQTDGVFEKICQKKTDYRICQQLLEQIVLTPTLAFHNCPDFLWDAFDGYLIDEGCLISLNDPEPEIPDQVESLSLDIIAGLIRAAGCNIPPSQFGPLADAALAALEEEEEYIRKTGKEAPNLMSKQFIDIFNKANLQIPHKYSDDEYEAQRLRNERYTAFKPVGDALSEYLSVVKSAETHNMLVKTPQFPDAGLNQLTNPQFVKGDQSEELILFRIVAEHLGKTTYRPTITGSLQLAKDPATVALREQLQLWRNELPKGNEQQLKAIQKDILHAQKSLSRLSGIQTIGTITTWLGVPVGIAELILSLPPVLGYTAIIVGKISSAETMDVMHQYKWAMFGNT